MNSILFSPFKTREQTLKNRIVMSPMCMYSAIEGVPTEWHLAHLGARAQGGCGTILVEATGVSPIGRITPFCTGLWNDKQKEAFKPIVEFVKKQNCKIGIQIAHAGRKGSINAPWLGGNSLTPQNGGWECVAPSELAFSESFSKPRSLTVQEIDKTLNEFCSAAERAQDAGFDVLEIHMAHGYLLHQFLSPISNLRNDDFGGSPENRMRFPLKVAKAVRDIWPKEKPLWVRISATDYVEGGWSVNDSILFCQRLKNIGIDLIDVSSGGSHPAAVIPQKPGYQVEFSAQIKHEAQIPTGAVGLITNGEQAESILKNSQSDLIFIGRQLLRNPYWPLDAAESLGNKEFRLSVTPFQYRRA
jgi:2,4-dienoyl-CoA reductase-like NADH-dependent reductase (Old Yellow Enzyme family)